jgi:hypothetical protein
MLEIMETFVYTIQICNRALEQLDIVVSIRLHFKTIESLVYFTGVSLRKFVHIRNSFVDQAVWTVGLDPAVIAKYDALPFPEDTILC